MLESGEVMKRRFNWENTHIPPYPKLYLLCSANNICKDFATYCRHSAKTETFKGAITAYKSPVTNEKFGNAGHWDLVGGAPG
jgi:hypothetical protein